MDADNEKSWPGVRQKPYGVHHERTYPIALLHESTDDRCEIPSIVGRERPDNVFQNDHLWNAVKSDHVLHQFPERFEGAASLAAESGTKFNGVLCGRATWKDGIAVYAKQGEKAFRDWLETEGVKNIQNVNEALKAASPWHLKFGATTLAELG